MDNILPITGMAVPAIDYDSILLNASKPDCHYLKTALESASLNYSSLSGQPEGIVATLKSLEILCSFMTNYHEPANLYGPYMQFEDKRSYMVSDLSEKDLETVAVLIQHTTNNLLKARLTDILWVRNKDHKMAKEAARIFLSLFEEIDKDDNWHYAIEYLRRGSQIANRLGRNQQQFIDIENSVLSALDQNLEETNQNYFHSLIELAHIYGLGSIDVKIEKVDECIERCRSEGNTHIQIEYIELQLMLSRKNKDRERSKALLIELGNCHLELAEKRLVNSSPSYMIASQFLAEGIEYLRQGGETFEKIDLLMRKLAHYQSHIASELSEFGHELDLTDLANESQKFLSGHPLMIAIFKLANGYPTIDIEDAKKALDYIEADSILNIIPGVLLDQKGKTIAKKIPGMTEEAKTQRLYEFASSTIWPIRAMSFIEPARLTLLNDHAPLLEDLEWIVEWSPVVPKGKRNVILRGLYAGLYGDTMQSTSLLIPNIEAILRYYAELVGIETSKLNSDLTQEFKMLSSLLDSLLEAGFINDSWYFEFQGILNERHGYNLRNKFAHGLLDDHGYYGVACVNLWWLTLKWCLRGLKVKIVEGEDTN